MTPLTIGFVLTICSLGVATVVGVLPCMFLYIFCTQNIFVALPLKMIGISSKKILKNIVPNIGHSRKNAEKKFGISCTIVGWLTLYANIVISRSPLPTVSRQSSLPSRSFPRLRNQPQCAVHAGKWSPLTMEAGCSRGSVPSLGGHRARCLCTWSSGFNNCTDGWDFWQTCV